jgi:hypothetical protein
MSDLSPLSGAERTRDERNDDRGSSRFIHGVVRLKIENSGTAPVSPIFVLRVRQCQMERCPERGSR